MCECYEVQITKHAYCQLAQIRTYIEKSLSAPVTAKKLLLKMRDEISKLSFLPFRHQCVNEEPWRKKGIRRLIVNNFNVYYWIDEEAKIVYITAIVYSHRSQIEQLANMEME